MVYAPSLNGHNYYPVQKQPQLVESEICLKPKKHVFVSFNFLLIVYLKKIKKDLKRAHNNGPVASLEMKS